MVSSSDNFVNDCLFFSKPEMYDKHAALSMNGVYTDNVASQHYSPSESFRTV